MCFPSAPDPPPPPQPDPELIEQKKAQFDANAERMREEKDKTTEEKSARAYGFYGIRSLLSPSSPGGAFAPAQSSGGQ